MSKRNSNDSASHRTVVKLVRFSPQEAEALNGLAHFSGRSFSALIREIVFERVPRSRRRADIDPILAELAKIGRELHELRVDVYDDAAIAETCSPAADFACDLKRMSQRLDAALTAHETAIRSLITRKPRGVPRNRESRKLDEPIRIETAVERSDVIRERGTSRTARRPIHSANDDPAQGALW
jgi:hypothetical protein